MSLKTTLAFILFLHLAAQVHAEHPRSGTLDETFGTNGTITAVPYGYFPTTMHRESNGRLLFGVSQAGDVNKFSVLAVTEQGTRDVNFGINGLVRLPHFQPPNQPDGFQFADVVTKISAQSNKKIILAGYTLTQRFGNPRYSGTDIALARIQENGFLDPTFGINGQFSTQLNTRYNYFTLHDLHIDPKDNIWIAASAALPEPCNFRASRKSFIVAKFLPDGFLDKKFANNGVLEIPQSQNLENCEKKPNEARAILYRDGFIFVGGSIDGQYTVLAFDAIRGEVYRPFGNHGRVSLNFFQPTDEYAPRDYANIIKMKLDPIGRFVIGLNQMVPSPDGSLPKVIHQSALVRLLNMGRPDISFGKKGVVLLEGLFAPLSDVTLTADRNILTVFGQFSEARVAQFDSTGHIDSDFGINGWIKIYAPKYFDFKHLQLNSFGNNFYVSGRGLHQGGFAQRYLLNY